MFIDKTFYYQHIPKKYRLFDNPIIVPINKEEIDNLKDLYNACKLKLRYDLSRLESIRSRIPCDQTYFFKMNTVSGKDIFPYHCEENEIYPNVDCNSLLMIDDREKVFQQFSMSYRLMEDLSDHLTPKYLYFEPYIINMNEKEEIRIFIKNYEIQAISQYINVYSDYITKHKWIIQADIFNLVNELQLNVQDIVIDITYINGDIKVIELNPYEESSLCLFETSGINEYEFRIAK